MRKLFLLVLITCLTLATGCTQEPEQQTSTTIPASSRSEAGNTARTADQTTPEALASTDQGQADEDLRITASVRESVTRDKSLSANARNIKIITSGGSVTLRGTVENEQERNKIEAYAELADGVDRVENMLEVAKKP
jgi:hyperosmotically inducible periplasmic protein